MQSVAERLAALPAEARNQILEGFTEYQLENLAHDWGFWGRPEQQIPEGNHWSTWLIMAGRGWGKTRTGAEFVRSEVASANVGRFALIGPTASDVRDVMVDGESGILNIGKGQERPKYYPSRRQLQWESTGAIATLYSADEPDRLRGPQHDAFWADEIAAWRYAEAWDMLQFGLRLGHRPRGVATTTPRPIKLIYDLLSDPTCTVTRGSTYDNRRNLPPKFFQQVVHKYEGTRLGRQELNAEVLEDVEGSLWPLALRERARVAQMPQDIDRLVIGVDPSVSATSTSDEIGIIVAARAHGHAYIMYDFSGVFSADQWGRRIVKAYHKLEADRIIAEVNNGGDLVETLLRTIDANVSYRSVHATKGKHKRAEPVAALYEQGKVHHVGYFAKLEEQMGFFTRDGYVGPDSPDRADALVWALTDLLIDNASATVSADRFMTLSM